MKPGYKANAQNTTKGEKCAPDIFIIMQNVFEDEEKIFIAIHAGAHGYFLKKSPPGNSSKVFMIYLKVMRL